MELSKKLGAEFFGTFWLVLGGTGTAVLAGSGVGTLGIALAFGLTVLTMVYAVGSISGGHFNPAVSFGLWAGGRFPGKDLLPYIVVQVVGAIAASAVRRHGGRISASNRQGGGLEVKVVLPVKQLPDSNA